VSAVAPSPEAIIYLERGRGKRLHVMVVHPPDTSQAFFFEEQVLTPDGWKPTTDDGVVVMTEELVRVLALFGFSVSPPSVTARQRLA